MLSILFMRIWQKKSSLVGNEQNWRFLSTATFYDLAGSEKIWKTGATNQSLAEAKFISRSFGELGNVFNALRARKGFVPFRDSKLTRLLKGALMDHYHKLSIIVNVSPDQMDHHESVSSMRFGSRAQGTPSKIDTDALEEAIRRDLPPSLDMLVGAVRTAVAGERTKPIPVRV